MSLADRVMRFCGRRTARRRIAVAELLEVADERVEIDLAAERRRCTGLKTVNPSPPSARKLFIVDPVGDRRVDREAVQLDRRSASTIRGASPR